MKKQFVISIAAGTALALAFVSGAADQGRRGGPDADRNQQIKQDQQMEMDRMQDRSRLDAPDRDRKRLHDADIYGHELMTGIELEHYRKQVKELNTVEAHERFRIQHEAKMQERAKQQGKDLVPPGQGPVYRGELMTVQERNEFREKLRGTGSEEDRIRLLAQHREKMDQRAQALDLEKEEAE